MGHHHHERGPGEQPGGSNGFGPDADPHRAALLRFELPATLVQRWLDQPSTNFGIALESTPTTIDGMSFTSSENALPNQRPQLVVEALVPE